MKVERFIAFIRVKMEKKQNQETIILQLLKDYSWVVYSKQLHILLFCIFCIFCNILYINLNLCCVSTLLCSCCNFFRGEAWLLLSLYRAVTTTEPKFDCCHLLQIIKIILPLAPGDCALLGVFSGIHNQCKGQSSGGKNLQILILSQIFTVCEHLLLPHQCDHHCHHCFSIIKLF